MEYIKGEADSEGGSGCIFCDKGDPQGDDQANHVVWRGRLAYVLLNTFPYNNGHLMIAPYAHIGPLPQVPLESLSEMMSLAQLAVQALEEAVAPQGVNLGINLGKVAGAGVEDHIHLHLVPRWKGDTNFMPVIADVRVIPESLDRTWESLRAAFVRLAG